MHLHLLKFSFEMLCSPGFIHFPFGGRLLIVSFLNFHLEVWSRLDLLAC